MDANPEQSKKINKCFSLSKYCTISTNGTNGWPESATVGFAADELTLVFATWKKTRKYKNIEQDTRVSFVFGFESGLQVQYEGRVEAIEKNHPLVERYLERKPGAVQYMNDPEYVFFKVLPVWARYSDFRAQPNERFEINLRVEEV